MNLEELIAVQPMGKQRVIQRLVKDICESEAFMETYPRVYDPLLAAANAEYNRKACQLLKATVLRLFQRNQVSCSDIERICNDIVKESKNMEAEGRSDLILARMGIHPAELYPESHISYGSREKHTEFHKLWFTPGFDKNKKNRIIFDYDPNEKYLVTRVFPMSNPPEGRGTQAQNR